MILKFFINEVDLKSSEHLCIHYFEIDRLDGYRELTSFNAFFHSSKRRNWSNKNTLFAEKHEDEFQRELEFWKKAFGKDKFEMVARKNHDSIWEFYKSIGYDYKTKKWSE